MDNLKTPIPTKSKQTIPENDDLKTPTPSQIAYQSHPLFQTSTRLPSNIANTKQYRNRNQKYSGLPDGYCMNKILIRRRLAPIPQIKIK